MRHLGPEYENFYVIALPANDIVYKKFDSELEECNKSDSNNSILDKCLIKINSKFKGEYEGYQSGIRSAILKIGEQHYRLKGCGNLDQGFIQRDMKFPKNSIEIRGCQFRHTALRGGIYE